ncbi:Smr/MutS family protein [Edaphosphingomonas haloaromaticamans]|uniref:Smr domain protein n=1 Tax=Edaphosphingomonas haloaromaticamans TaxID=653954 RepID=A0A1S1HAQ6_9SPHN|nr:Smr/MutS family protein [Sphingomonas haloaromaticamans]OHT19207.1 Smr domain protein [Sphingomonas haloaromaticamans]
MAGRRLDAEERALWRKVTATVRPLHPERPAPAEPAAGSPPPAPPPKPLPKSRQGRVPPPPPPSPRASAAAEPADTLDGGWDRRLRRGIVAPDRTIDLHGHTLAGAHAALEAALASAIAADARVLLVVTGRAPRPGAPGRGLIRAAIDDWLGASGWSSRIAAVRAAHPRHGGAGALYVVLRRRR